MVCKFGTAVGTNWAKLIDLGDGAGLDNIVITWDGNVFQSGRIGMQIQTNAATYPLYNYGIGDFLTPVPNQWYHIVIQMQRSANAFGGIGAGAANWFSSTHTLHSHAPNAMLPCVLTLPLSVHPRVW